VRVAGEQRRSLWASPGRDAVLVIDQRWLPHELRIEELRSVAAVHEAIRDMWVRGAPLIGATAAYGIALQCSRDAGAEALRAAEALLNGARPTAVNLAWATRRMCERLLALPERERRDAAWREAAAIADEDVAVNAAIGRYGSELLRALAERRRATGRRGPVNVLTHCNAGWLATVDRGTALAPVYAAHESGLELHVWVDETRPRNQGASLTAWELGQEGVPHTVIADNAGGHLMQRGDVDIVLVGADRVSARGDVCNKIGTYLKALAAQDTGVPFHVALPLATLDLALDDGLDGIPIEERSEREVTHVTGRDANGRSVEVRLVPDGAAARNPAFDVTPARLVSGFITERGLVAANERALRSIAQDRSPAAASAAAGGGTR